MGAPRVDAGRISNLHDYWLDLKSRQIWLQSIEGRSVYVDGEEGDAEPGVEYQMAIRFIKNLHLMLAASRKPVTIHMHVGGGFFDEGLAIYDAIRLMPYKTTIISYTQASSASSYILQAAHRRLMLPSSHFMFHWGESSVFGSPANIKSTSAYYEKQVEQMLDIYTASAIKGVKFEGWTEKQVRKHIKEVMDRKGDTYLTPTEAVEWGFADAVVTKFPV